MKKLIVLFILLFAVTANAGPFLVCDPQDGVTQYELIFNGNSVFVDAEPDGSVRYDLEGLAEDSYSLVGKAGNEWGWSAPSDPPYLFTKDIPGLPTGWSTQP